MSLVKCIFKLPIDECSKHKIYSTKIEISGVEETEDNLVYPFDIRTMAA